MHEDMQGAQIPPDTRSPWQRRTDALWAATKWQAYLNVYCRFIYRPHMRLIHRYGWHWHKHLHIIDDGSEQLWCQWCGDRWTRQANRWVGVSSGGIMGGHVYGDGLKPR